MAGGLWAALGPQKPADCKQPQMHSAQAICRLFFVPFVFGQVLLTAKLFDGNIWFFFLFCRKMRDKEFWGPAELRLPDMYS